MNDDKAKMNKEQAVAYLQARFTACKSIEDDVWDIADRLCRAAQVLLGVDGKHLSREGVLAVQLLAIDIAEGLGEKMP